MNCDQYDVCEQKECEYIRYIEGYLNESVIAFACPDKEEKYLAKKDRGKEIDLILETVSSKWAVEAKKIVLGKKAEEENVYRLIEMITGKLGDDRHTVHLKIKKGLQPKWNSIEVFLDEYIRDGGNSIYSNKYVDIRLDKVTGEEGRDQLFSKVAAWEPSKQQGDLSKIKAVSLILSSNNGKQRFIVDFAKTLAMDSFIYIGRDAVGKMNEKIRMDSAKFEEYDDYRKMFFFDLVLPQHLKEFYEEEHPMSDILKRLVFEDIEKEMEYDLERPESIAVLLMLSMDNPQGTEDCYFWGSGID